MSITVNESGIDHVKYCEFYLFRHGESKSNVGHIMDGQIINGELTENGKNELKEIAENFKDIHFDAIFSSDLLRARQTAEILKAHRDLEVKALKMLREKHYGKYEGKSYQEYRTAVEKVYPELGKGFGIYWNEEKFYFRPDESVETYAEAGTRYIEQLREIALGYIGKRVLVVGHGSGLRSFIVKALGERYEITPAQGFRNGEHCVVLSDGVEFLFKSLPVGKDYGVVK